MDSKIHNVFCERIMYFIIKHYVFQKFLGDRILNSRFYIIDIGTSGVGTVKSCSRGD